MMTSSQLQPPPPSSCQNTSIFGLELAFLLIKSPAIVVIPTKIVTSRQLFIFLARTILPEERESEGLGSKLLSSGWPVAGNA